MVLLGQKNKLTTTVDFISQSNKAINIQLRFWDDNWYDDWAVKVYREDVLNSWQKYIGKELLRSRPWNYMIWTVRFHVAVWFTNKLRHVLTEGIIHDVIGIYMVRVPILLVRYLKILLKIEAKKSIIHCGLFFYMTVERSSAVSNQGL